MKKIFLAVSVLAIIFLPAALSLVLAQESAMVSFHLSVAKKTIQGDGTFDFAIEKQAAVTPIGIKDFAKVFALDITDQKNEFSITTENRQGVYDADYEIALNGYSYLKLVEGSAAGWETKDIVCSSSNEDFSYSPSGSEVLLFNVRNGDRINCEFINEKTKNPVLIVPGLLGTELIDEDENKEIWPNIIGLGISLSDDFLNQLKFDSGLNSLNEIIPGEVIKKELGFFDYSENLINHLVSSEVGYKINETLFTFPYDWRYGVSGIYPDGITTNSDLLKEKIQEIREQTGADEVDIIAHSLGGLVAKKYVMENSVPHIGKLVFVGTPNFGSPVAAKAILVGHNFDIAVLSGGRIKEISGNMPAAHDLLPSFRYRDKITNYIKLAEEQTGGIFTVRNLGFPESQTFLDDHGANEFALNQSNFVHNISGLDDFDVRVAGVDAYKIVGCASGMLMQIKANKKLDGSVAYEPYSYISSDNTVPFGSADSIFAENEKSFYAIKSKHGALMGENGVRQTISNILTESKLETGNNVIDKNQLINNINRCALNGVAVKIYSPLDINIFDRNGKCLGLDSNDNMQNDIPGASFDIIDGHKFVYLPLGAGEEYQIDLQGTDSGTFTLETQNIENNIETNSRVFENIAVNPALKAILDIASNETILKLDNNGDGEIDEIFSRTDVVSDVSAPVIKIDSPESGKIYLNNQILPINYRVADDKTATDTIEVNISLDNVATIDSVIDLAFQKTGDHALKIEAKDEAGNATSTVTVFKVSASIDSIIANVNRYTTMGLISKAEKSILNVQLQLLKTQFRLLEQTKNNSRLSAKAKTLAIKILKSTINSQIDIVIKKIQKTNSKIIDSNTAFLLIDSLRYIRIK